ncbi:hypothetical protein OIDMADRAFT_100306 [Oidiodendron maius Zn]|uniref:MRG-binding protein n=1 Tax=Oidiodendron maius (strain Zn) TaxID=913774 RepID=A0A0C3HK20_OIDMZ|nr:hypothetical protein OIDMADRAFT_100306 [Oidiodendron maius Zn]
MPPRKKAKRGVSTPVGDDDGMEIDAPTPDVEEANEPSAAAYDIVKDPWTDEQETALFKGIIRWKPNGMHKHFRMIALAEHLRNHGCDEKHTRIPGIWEKLKTLYNMEMIDAREDSAEDEEEEEVPFIDFELPDKDYGLETFMRGKRSLSEAPSSPPRLARTPSPPPVKRRKRGDTVTTTKTRASTVDDTDEAKTSPPRSPPTKITRAGRSAMRSQVRAKAESTSRAQSKDTTMDEDEGAEETEETAEDEEQEAEGEGRSVSPRPTRGSSKAKADAAAKGANPSRKSKRKR